MRYFRLFSNRDKCRLEAAGDVVSGTFVGLIVLDKCLRDLRLNRSRESPPEAVGCSIFDGLFRYNFQPEVDNDVISGVAVDNVGVDVAVNIW